MTKPSKRNRSIASQVQTIIKQLGTPMDMLMPLAKATHSKKTITRITEYCKAQITMVLGDIRAEKQAELKEIQSRRKHHAVKIAQQQKRVDHTDTMIAKRDVVKQDCPDMRERGLRKSLDYGLGAFCFCMAIAVLCIGAGNVYAIIMASGTPVFLEEPALARSLSAILPIGAFALEFFKRHLISDTAKRRYTKGVYILCALLLITWIILFAIVFGAASDQSIDLDAMMNGESEADPLGRAFTVIQLLAELFVGAALFMTGGDLFGKHMHSIQIANPDYTRAKALLDSMKADDSKEAKLEQQAQSWVNAIENGEQLYIADQIATYEQLRAQYQ